MSEENPNWVKRLQHISTQAAKGIPFSAKTRKERIEAYLDVAGGLGEIQEIVGGVDHGYSLYIADLINDAHKEALPQLEERLTNYLAAERYYPMLVWVHELINALYFEETYTPGNNPSASITSKIQSRFINDPHVCLQELNDYAPVIRAMLAPLSSTLPTPKNRAELMQECW